MFYVNLDTKWGIETIAEFSLKREAQEFSYNFNTLPENRRNPCFVDYNMYIGGRRVTAQEIEQLDNFTNKQNGERG